MGKYQINYSRKFPDHRVTIDHTFNRIIMSSPAAYMRYFREGFHVANFKYFHVSIAWASLALFGVVGMYYVWDSEIEKSHCLAKKNLPVYKYMHYTKQGGYGAYDNILKKFEKEPGGIRDLPFDN